MFNSIWKAGGYGRQEDMEGRRIWKAGGTK
jgi:hypothetical protein